jgi:hypothetical protein
LTEEKKMGPDMTTPEGVERFYKASQKRQGAAISRTASSIIHGMASSGYLSLEDDQEWETWEAAINAVNALSALLEAQSSRILKQDGEENGT